MQVKKISAGWKGLEGVLNQMIDAINYNDPLEGDGIRIIDTGNGKLVSAAAKGKTASPSDSGNPSGGGGSGGFTPGQYQLTLGGVTWKDVTLVDPSDCSSTTASILVKSDGDSITLIANVTQIS